MQVIAIALAICLVLVGGFLGIGEALRCEHEDTCLFISFTSYNSTSHSSMREICRDCGDNITSPTLFDGTLKDKSYLELIRANSDGSEIIPGEYYTVTATVPLGFYGNASNTVQLTCQVENDDYMVRFHAEFREEFMDEVVSVEKGETITFRGRFYDEGCGFTDCELITGVE